METTRGTIRLSDTAVLEKPFTYVSDASEIKLEETAEGKKQSWIQALPIGLYEHPLWGTLDITKERVKKFAENVNNNVRGQQLDIDYEHKEGSNGGIAAGWVVKAEDRGDDGLWILVEWTDKAANHIKASEYKYFSPEFDWTWTHPKTKKTHENVLFGGALTNRPFLKDILPVNLSEVLEGMDLGEIFNTPEGKYSQQDAHYAPASRSTRRCGNCAFFRASDKSCLIVDGEIEEDHVSDYFQAIYSTAYYFNELPEDQQEKVKALMEREVAKKASEVREEAGVDPKELRKALGLSEDAADADVLAKAKELAEASQGPSIKQLSETLGLQGEVDGPKVLEEIKSLKETKLTTPEEREAKKFAEQFPEQAKQLADQAKQLRESTVEKKLEEWGQGKITLEDGKKPKVIPPVLHDDLRDFRMKLSDEHVPGFDALMTKLITHGTVSLEEIGGGGPASETEGDDAQGEFAAKVKEEQAEAKKAGDEITLTEATARATRKHPQLAENWRKARKTRSESA